MLLLRHCFCCNTVVTALLLDSYRLHLRRTVVAAAGVAAPAAAAAADAAAALMLLFCSIYTAQLDADLFVAARFGAALFSSMAGVVIAAAHSIAADIDTSKLNNCRGCFFKNLWLGATRDAILRCSCPIKRLFSAAAPLKCRLILLVPSRIHGMSGLSKPSTAPARVRKHRAVLSRLVLIGQFVDV